MFGASFNDEPDGLRKDQGSRGLLCMANSGPDTNASQFYITLAPCPHLSGSHVRFGRLVSGDAALAAAEAAAPAQGAGDAPSLPVKYPMASREAGAPS